MTFTSIIRFDVQPGAEAAFEEAFEKSGMLSRPKVIEGFCGAELVKSIEPPATYHVIGRWQSRQAYIDWQDVAAAQADPAAMTNLLQALVAPKPGKLFSTIATTG